MKRKFKNPKGETIIEVLCAILVAGLASGLLMSCFIASHSMAQQARKADRNLRKSITAAEEQRGASATEMNVKIKYIIGNSPNGESTIPVYAYGDNNVYSYKKK